MKEVHISQFYYPHFRLEKIRLRESKLNFLKLLTLINGKSLSITLFSEPWSNTHSQIAFGETCICAMRQVSQKAVIIDNLL